MTGPDNTITITCGNISKAGWTAVSLTRGIEAVPSTLELSVTEEYPTRSGVLPFAPGQPCVVTIGADVALTGYIDRYIGDIGPGSHTVVIYARSRVQDSVDASAEFGQAQASQVSWATLADLATQLVSQPYDIHVCDKAKSPDTVPQFNINLGETSFDIISRVAHTMGVLVYDNAQGDLVLAKVGQEGVHASGFQEGQGVQNLTVNFAMDQRFSEYVTLVNGIDVVRNVTGGGTNIEGGARDQDVPRNRKKYIISPVPSGVGKTMEEWGNQVALFEKNRRWGRGHAVEITCDSWRDSAGRLWTPNSYATVNAPTAHLINEQWIIASVTYSLTNENGTVARLVLMPAEAFSIEPTVLFRLPPNLAGGGAAQSIAGVPPT